MANPMFQPEIEMMTREKMKNLQEERLREIVSWAFERTGFYRQMFNKLGITPSDIKTLEDLQKIPPWQKDRYREDQKQHPPFGTNLALPREELTMICLGSGTTGEATVNPFTELELDAGSDVVARALVATGVQAGWVFYDITPQGLHYGWSYVLRRAAEKTKMVHTAGDFLEHPVMGPKRRLDYLTAVRPQFIFGAGPSITAIGNMLKANNIENPFKVIWWAGEAGPATIPSTRKFLKNLFPGATPYDVVGPMDIAMFYGYECSEQNGMHVPEDHIIIEVLDRDTNEPLPPGKRGKVVMTALSRRSFPLIRFDLEDVSAILSEEPCACGRTMKRLIGTLGRTGDLLEVEGKMFLPSDIERIARDIPELTGEYQMIRRTPKMDVLQFRLELQSDLTDEQAVKQMVKERFEGELGVPVEVQFVPKGSLVTPGYKSPRVAKE